MAQALGCERKTMHLCTLFEVLSSLSHANMSTATLEIAQHCFSAAELPHGP